MIIKDSNVEANVIVTRDNDGLNFATGIGGNDDITDADFINNNFTIIQSTVSGHTRVGRRTGFLADNRIENFGVGIGGNAAFSASADFINNFFTIKNRQIAKISEGVLPFSEP